MLCRPHQDQHASVEFTCSDLLGDKAFARARAAVRMSARSLALGLLVAAPAFAEDSPTAAEREAFIAVLVANGCQMTEPEAAIKMPEVGIDQQTSGDIARELVEEGLAELDDAQQVFVLKTEGCAP